MASTYDCTIRWRDGLTGALVATVSGYESFEAARGACEELAAKAGWHPRRWWELWRLGEMRTV